MLVLQPTGELFATGAAPYSYRPEYQSLDIPKLFLQVAVEGVHVEALMDTGAMFCSPDLAQHLHLRASEALAQQTIVMRGESVQGALHRVALTLVAEVGDSLSIEVTALVPNEAEEERFPHSFPCFLGLFGCLERLRFAIDPSMEMVYFGSLS